MLEGVLGAPKAEGTCIGWLSPVLTPPSTPRRVREMQALTLPSCCCSLVFSVKSAHPHTSPSSLLEGPPLGFIFLKQ